MLRQLLTFSTQMATDEAGLSYTPVRAAMAAELAQLQLSNLISVTLVKTGLTAAALSELARADWPALKMLHFNHSALYAAAIQHLSIMRMPSLHTSILDSATITVEGAFWLALRLLAFAERSAFATQTIGCRGHKTHSQCRLAPIAVCFLGRSV